MPAKAKKKSAAKVSKRTKKKSARKGNKVSKRRSIIRGSRTADIKRCMAYKGNLSECRSNKCWYNYDTGACEPLYTRSEVARLKGSKKSLSKRRRSSKRKSGGGKKRRRRRRKSK